MIAAMFRGKPIIGITGGIGAGKTFVARLFGEMGCLVISSDEQVRELYSSLSVVTTLREWWGDAVVGADGKVDRSFVAAKVFNDAAERRRLEGLIHPLVAAARDRAMEAAAEDPAVVAFVWDTPLLFETGLNRECDAVIFVDAPAEVRLSRVAGTRHWDAAELSRRENSQWGLDRKRQMSDYVLSNAADAGSARQQVKAVLSQILSRAKAS
jgi:dephospho-CoA kinase